MIPAVHALAEKALMYSPHQYGFTVSALLLLLATQIARLVLRRYKLLVSISKIPGPPALPIFGNALSLAIAHDDIFKLFLTYGQKYGRLFRLWIGVRPYIVLSRAEDIQPILTSIHHIDKSFEYMYLKDWLGDGLIILSGPKWQKRRKLLSPAFHCDILTNATDTICKQIDVLLDILSKYEENGTIFNAIPPIKNCTLDIICATTMGVAAGAQTNSNQAYVQAIEKLTCVIQKRFFSPWLKSEFVFKRTALGKMQAEAVEVVNSFVHKVIREKRQEKKERKFKDDTVKTSKNFLDLLLDANEAGADFTDQDLNDEVQTFMFAGHDSTACALGWTLFVLGSHPEAQEKILQEAEKHIKPGIPINQQLKNLQYLDACIKEVMRLYPVAPIIARDIRQPVLLPSGEIIPPGVTAVIHLPLLHQDPTHFPNPDKFQPERFASTNTDQRHPFAYIPFSAGPRNCIGLRFAHMTIKLILLKILQRFHVTAIDSTDKLKLITKLVLINKEGIRISLKRRK